MRPLLIGAYLVLPVFLSGPALQVQAADETPAISKDQADQLARDIQDVIDKAGLTQFQLRSIQLKMRAAQEKQEEKLIGTFPVCSVTCTGSPGQSGGGTCNINC